MKIILTASRPSIAYKQDGTQVASEVPRYETGLCGQGIMIEEGATNVFLNSNVPVTQSIAVTTANSGKWTTTVWGAGTVTTSSGSATASGYGVASAGSPNTVTVTVNGTVVFTVAGADATTKVQVENKAYGTSHMVTAVTDVTRNAETLTRPTSFTKGNMTEEFVFIPTSTQVVAGKVGVLWDCYINANNYYRLLVYFDGRVYLQVVSGGASVDTWTLSDPVLAVGTKYRIWFKMNGATMCHGIGATKGLAGDVAYVKPVGSLPANEYLGSTCLGTNRANGIFDEWATSSIARTDASLAARGASIKPLPIDEYTILKANFNNSLYAIKNRLIKPVLRPTTKPWTY